LFVLTAGNTYNYYDLCIILIDKPSVEREYEDRGLLNMTDISRSKLKNNGTPE